jgi:hypothetical protein
MNDCIWADAAGLPTKHAIRSALQVAALIDPDGSRVADARETYWHVASGAVLPPDDLAAGERLLLDLGLAVVIDGMLFRTAVLDDLLEGDAPSAAASVLLASLGDVADAQTVDDELRLRLEDFGLSDEQINDAAAAAVAKFDATYRTLVGDIGEEIVVAEARAELVAAGRDDLARSVRRVSLVSDAYGYDVVAPRLHGADRLLEVKATATPVDDEMVVFLSRHEANVGVTRSNWMMVVCQVQDVDTRRGAVLGWLPFESIKRYMPTDGDNSRWEAASIRISLGDIVPGLPSAFI